MRKDLRDGSSACKAEDRVLLACGQNFHSSEFVGANRAKGYGSEMPDLRRKHPGPTEQITRSQCLERSPARPWHPEVECDSSGMDHPELSRRLMFRKDPKIFCERDLPGQFFEMITVFAREQSEQLGRGGHECRPPRYERLGGRPRSHAVYTPALCSLGIDGTCIRVRGSEVLPGIISLTRSRAARHAGEATVADVRGETELVMWPPLAGPSPDCRRGSPQRPPQ